MFGLLRRRLSPIVAEPVEYLNAHAASSSTYKEKTIDPAYRQLVRFFNCALLDRTKTLQPGFSYRILSPLAQSLEPVESAINSLCDRRGDELVRLAAEQDKPLYILWSGGIDSTTAFTACLKAARAHHLVDRIQVWLTRHSIRENRHYFNEVIKPQVRFHKTGNLRKSLDPRALIVTGELGDQIFGSMLAADYLEQGVLFNDWQTTFEQALHSDPKRIVSATQVIDYLSPQLSHSPVPINTFFDLLWWLNFSLKWQIVQLRLAASQPKKYAELRPVFHHFFDNDQFQQWSLQHHSEKISATWPSYKMPLKRYIYDFFPDQNYLQHKCKEPSLQRIFRFNRIQRVAGSRFEISQSGIICQR